MYYHRHISKCECITIDTVFVFGGGGGSVGPGEGWRGQVEVFGAEERGMAWGETECGGVHGF